MSEPIHLFNDKVIDSQSMGADITSSSKNVQEAISYSVHCIWSAGSTPVGTLDLQGSNDDVNFTSVLESGPAPISGNSGSLLINVEKHSYGYMRVVYTRTSGSGTMTTLVNAKRG